MVLVVPGTGNVLRILVGLLIFVLAVEGAWARREGFFGLGLWVGRGELRVMVESEERLFMVLGEPEARPGLTSALEGLSLLRTPVRPVVLGLESLDASALTAGAEEEAGRPMPMFEDRLARTGTTEVEMQLVRGLPTGFVDVILDSGGFP
jgi:hypothetical protein